MPYLILFTHEVTKVSAPIEGKEFRYVDQGFAEKEAAKFNLADNPAWKGTFAVIHTDSFHSI